MAHAFWESSPFLKTFSRKMGLITTDFKLAVRTLKKNKLLVIFPEAEHGNFKPSHKMYQLADFNPGFVALSLMTQTPIVPVAILGAEENYINIGTIDWFEDQIGAKIPIPLNLLPLPSKWKIKFLKPISLNKYTRKDVKNEKFLVEVAQNVRFRIQAAIHKELVTAVYSNFNKRLEIMVDIATLSRTELLKKLKVEDLMTREVLTIDYDDLIGKAARLMIENHVRKSTRIKIW